MQYLNTASASQMFTITNTGAQALTFSSFSIRGSQFRWAQGTAPQTLPPGGSIILDVVFFPTIAGPALGSLTLHFAELPGALAASLSGTGVSSTASASVVPSTLTFRNQPVGTAGSAQVTISNVGKSALTVENIAVLPSQFTILKSGFPLSLNPGQSTTIQIQYAPTAVTTDNGLLTVSYAELPSTTVALTGIGASVPLNRVAVTVLPNLPGATQSAPYTAVLTGAGGKTPYSWSLVSGRPPSGLSLSKTGVISGTLQPGFSVGTYAFTVRLTDSSTSPLSVDANLNLGVTAPTGSNCTNISTNITGTSTPLTPLDQLGRGTYLGFPGGLYLNGSDTMPANHLTAGIQIANTIQPLDANGNPSSSGKYVLLSLGESNPTFEFGDFLSYAANDPTLHPNLVIVQGAQPQETASALLSNSSTPGFMNNVLNYALPYAGVNAKQVVAIWFEPEDAYLTATFPNGAQLLSSELVSLAQQFLTTFPNLKIMYLSSRTYAGYSNGVSQLNPEPVAYQQGYAVQFTIDSQLAGNPALNFDPSLGPVKAPWLAWGPYYWGNGMTPHNGIVWACSDFMSDGVHPDMPARDKVATQLMNFFKTDPTAAPWYVAK
jgi:hypothetical protein